MRVAPLLRSFALAAAAAAPCCLAQAHGQEAPADAEKTEIRLNVKPGDVFWFRTTQSQTQSVMGMDTTNDVVQEMSYTVKSVPAEGGAVMDMRFGRIRGKMVNPMLGEVEFDTAKPESLQSDAPQIAVMVKVLTAISGKSIEMTLDGHGMPTSAKGFAAIMKEALAQGGDESGMAAMLESMLTDDTFVDQMKQAWPVSAAGPVWVGRKWKGDSTMKLGPMPMKIAYEHSVTGLSADDVTISSAMTMDIKDVIKGAAEKAAEEGRKDGSGPSAEEVQKQLDGMKQDCTGETRTRVSRKDGLPLATDMSLNMKIGMQQQGMEIEVTMVQTMKMERLPGEPAAPTAEKGADKQAEKPADGK